MLIIQCAHTHRLIMTCVALMVTLSLIGLIECFVVPIGTTITDNKKMEDRDELSSMLAADESILKSISTNLTSFSYLSSVAERQQMFRLNIELFVLDYCWTIDRLECYGQLNVSDHIERGVVDNLEENLLGLQLKLRLFFHRYYLHYDDGLFQRLTRYCLVEKEADRRCGLDCALVVSGFFVIPLAALFVFRVLWEQKYLTTKLELVHIASEPKKCPARSYRTF